MVNGIRVLYVDDEESLLEIGKSFLEDNGEFSVDTALSASVALDILNKKTYDAIVSDFQMPEMDGIELLKSVRAFDKIIPFILFTGRGREEIVIEAINNGADFYLQKGGDASAQFAELRHQIQQAVARKKGQDELRSAYEQITASEEELREQYREIATAQQKLLETQQQLAEIAGTIPGVVYQFYVRPDGSMGFYYVSSRAPEIFGIGNDADRFFDQFSAHTDPRDKDAFLDSIRNVVSSGSSWNFEGRFIRPSGEPIWFLGLARPVKKGSELIYYGVLLDITDRKKAEEEIRESGRKLREAQEMAHLGFWSWDIKTGYVEWSDEVFRIFGLDPNEFTPQIDSILELSPWPEDHQRDREVTQKAIESHEPGAYDQRFLRPDKSIGYYHSTFQGRYDESGNLISIIGTVLDITERKLAEAALREASRRLNLLNSITRHDVMNQLTMLQGFAHFAAMKVSDPVISGYLAKIDASAVTIRRQIEFMKAYQELGIHTPGWFRFDELVAKTGKKEVICSGSCTGTEVFADPMLEKVFFNLFENAVHHGEHVTEIHVSGKEGKDGLTITVEDNGIGIPPGEKEKIFEKGFGKNTGLGLFLAKEILSITGITIRENGTPGKGAKFEISVPKGMYRVIGK